VGPRSGLDPMEKSLASAGNRTPAIQPVAIPTELSRLIIIIIIIINKFGLFRLLECLPAAVSYNRQALRL
jgi:hypothetical protein